jgi:hypothetical protein
MRRWVVQGHRSAQPRVLGDSPHRAVATLETSGDEDVGQAVAMQQRRQLQNIAVNAQFPFRLALSVLLLQRNVSRIW